ncbi:hypothetical protein NliqN6_4918 [Naganishia liquefaciens]|uniref:Uncharacterized protein n=1 Tax=Naganishia liquefaciens TaxID=104408 RepID=A0A8H3TVU3_9TREE|nr:hypothetical protein NliqN6_4918 [Naganishia liquefaciens]
MPTALAYRNTCLASVPEDELLEKQKSIKRSAHHRSSHSLPAVHIGESSRPGLIPSSSGNRSYKGKGKEVVDRAPCGEWVVNVNEMDIGLEVFGEKRRVILVFGDMPFTTRRVITTSGNFSNTLFILAPSDSLAPRTSDDDPTRISAVDNSDKVVEFWDLPFVDVELSSDPVDEYRSLIREARKLAKTWRTTRKMAQISTPSVRSSRGSDANRNSKSRPQEFRKSRSFSLLSLSYGDTKDEAHGSDKIDAIISYLPSQQIRDTEANFHALLRKFCDVTTAISPMLQEPGRSSEQDGNDVESNDIRTRLIYVLPEHYPANLLRTLQTYLFSAISVAESHRQGPRAFLVGRRTMDRKMQRQEDRYPVTGLEIILSNSLWWNARTGSQAEERNVFLEDFKQCRFILAPAIESFDSSSANASHSSLSNTATTDGVPLTPRLSPDQESILDNDFRSDKTSSEFEDGSSSITRPVSTTTSSVSFKKKAPFLRRIFSVERSK